MAPSSTAVSFIIVLSDAHEDQLPRSDVRLLFLAYGRYWQEIGSEDPLSCQSDNFGYAEDASRENAWFTAQLICGQCDDFVAVTKASH